MKKALATIALIALTGCAKTTTTDNIIDNAIFSTQAAIHTIKKTTTLEQCQALATAQYNDNIRTLETAKISAKHDIKAEQERTLRWKIIAIFIGIIFATYIAKQVIK